MLELLCMAEITLMSILFLSLGFAYLRGPVPVLIYELVEF